MIIVYLDSDSGCVCYNTLTVTVVVFVTHDVALRT